MKWVKRIILGIAVLFGVFLAGAFFLPSQVKLSRSIIIAAPAEKVFPWVNDLKKFNEWSPWSNIDPDMVKTYKGAESGVGQIYQWKSDKYSVGSGTQKIVESVVGKKVGVALDMGDRGKAKSSWELDAMGKQTKVTWNFQTDLGSNPLERWMGLFVKSMVGSSYDKGLKSLKVIVEK